MTEKEAPKIEFPCPNYPIKVLGDKSEQYKQDVLAVMEKFSPGFDRSKVTERDSRNGRYQSITVFIEATGVDQLQGIFDDLKTLPSTKMVL